MPRKAKRKKLLLQLPDHILQAARRHGELRATAKVADWLGDHLPDYVSLWELAPDVDRVVVTIVDLCPCPMCYNREFISDREGRKFFYIEDLTLLR